MVVKLKIPANWKPILVGIVAIITAAWQTLHYANFAAAIADPAFPQRLGSALLIAVLAFVTKQHNVTGGTVGQPSTLEALADANQHPSAVQPPAK